MLWNLGKGRGQPNGSSRPCVGTGRVHHAALVVHLLPVLLHLAHVLLHHWALLCRDVATAFDGFPHGRHLFLHVSELRLQLLDLLSTRGSGRRGLLSECERGKTSHIGLPLRKIGCAITVLGTKPYNFPRSRNSCTFASRVITPSR